MPGLKKSVVSLQKSNHFQIRQILRKLTGEKWVLDLVNMPLEDVVNRLYCDGRLGLPCSPENIWIIYERSPVLTELTHPRSSPLISSLLDRNGEETALVFDMLLRGSDAIRFVSIYRDMSAISNWVSNLTIPDIVVRPIDVEWFAITSPLFAFVKPKEVTA